MIPHVLVCIAPSWLKMISKMRRYFWLVALYYCKIGAGMSLCSDLNPLDGGQSIYPMNTVFFSELKITLLFS